MIASGQEPPTPTTQLRQPVAMVGGQVREQWVTLPIPRKEDGSSVCMHAEYLALKEMSRYAVEANK